MHLARSRDEQRQQGVEAVVATTEYSLEASLAFPRPRRNGFANIPRAAPQPTLEHQTPRATRCSAPPISPMGAATSETRCASMQRQVCPSHPHPLRCLSERNLCPMHSRARRDALLKHHPSPGLRKEASLWISCGQGRSVLCHAQEANRRGCRTDLTRFIRALS